MRQTYHYFHRFKIHQWLCNLLALIFSIKDKMKQNLSRLLSISCLLVGKDKVIFINKEDYMQPLNSEIAKIEEEEEEG